MSDNSRWVEEAVLREAAFELFSSNSIDRYFRMARRFASQSALAEHFGCGLVTLEELITRATQLRGQSSGKDCRDIEEVELALILTILAGAASEQISELLVDVSLYDKLPMTWISALARKLYQGRASDLLGLPEPHVSTTWMVEFSAFPSLEDDRDFSPQNEDPSISIREDYPFDRAFDTTESEDIEAEIAA
jgi:hypothetical protein